MDTVFSKAYGGIVRVTVEYDEYPFDLAEEFDYVQLWYKDDSRYVLGSHSVSYDKMQEMKEDEQFFNLPYYAYIHSGVSVSISGFSCPWDSGHAGYVVGERKSFDNDFEAFYEAAKSVVEEFDAIISGQVFWYKIEVGETCNMGHVHYETVDSCGAFVGRNFDDNGLLAHLTETLKSEKHNAPESLHKFFDEAMESVKEELK